MCMCVCACVYVEELAQLSQENAAALALVQVLMGTVDTFTAKQELIANSLL